MVTFLLNEEVEKRKQEYTREDFDREGDDVIDQLAFGSKKLMNEVKAILEDREYDDDDD